MKKGIDEAELLRKIGANIRKARKVESITQEQLAYECGVSRTQIRTIEKGSHEPGILILLKIAEVLGVDITQVVAEKKDKEKKQ